jgi:hypothetical protein
MSNTNTEKEFTEQLNKFSAAIFNLDYEEFEKDFSTKKIDDKIATLKIILQELYKMKSANIDPTQYLLGRNNGAGWKSVQRFHPSLREVLIMDRYKTTLPEAYFLENLFGSNTGLGGVNKHSNRPISGVNRDIMATTKAAKTLMARTGILAHDLSNNKPSVIQMSGYSTNVLRSNYQHSTPSEGVIYSTLPGHRMAILLYDRRVNFLSIPHIMMEERSSNYVSEGPVTPSKKNSLIDLSRDTCILIGNKELIFPEDTSIPSDQYEKLMLYRNTQYPEDTISVVFPFLSMATEEMFELNRLLFSAWPAAAYSHSHFETRWKTSSHYCRGSNVFDTKFSNGINNLSELTGFIADVALFVETLNVSDSYGTAPLPPLIGVGPYSNKQLIDEPRRYDNSENSVGIYVAYNEWGLNRKQDKITIGALYPEIQSTYAEVNNLLAVMTNTLVRVEKLLTNNDIGDKNTIDVRTTPYLPEDPESFKNNIRDIFAFSNPLAGITEKRMDKFLKVEPSELSKVLEEEFAYIETEISNMSYLKEGGILEKINSIITQEDKGILNNPMLYLIKELLFQMEQMAKISGFISQESEGIPTKIDMSISFVDSSGNFLSTGTDASKGQQLFTLYSNLYTLRQLLLALTLDYLVYSEKFQSSAVGDMDKTSSVAIGDLYLTLHWYIRMLDYSFSYAKTEDTEEDDSKVSLHSRITPITLFNEANPQVELLLNTVESCATKGPLFFAQKETIDSFLV